MSILSEKRCKRRWLPLAASVADAYGAKKEGAGAQEGLGFITEAGQGY